MKNTRPLSSAGWFSRFDETLHVEMDFSLDGYVSTNGQVCCNVRFSRSDYVCKRETFPSSFLTGDNRAQLKCNAYERYDGKRWQIKKKKKKKEKAHAPTHIHTLYFFSSSIKANGFLFLLFFLWKILCSSACMSRLRGYLHSCLICTRLVTNNIINLYYNFQRWLVCYWY